MSPECKAMTLNRNYQLTSTHMSNNHKGSMKIAFYWEVAKLAYNFSRG